MLFEKPNGDKRLCINYKLNNGVPKILTYPLPQIHQALDALHGKRYSSVFDLLKAYCQIEAKPASREYLDYLVVFSDSSSKTLAHSKAPFVRSVSARLQLAPTKFALCQKETRYLGFIALAKEVRPDSAKTNPIANLSAPTENKGLRRFLGIESYFNDFYVITRV